MDTVASFTFYLLLRLFHALGMDSFIDLMGRQAGYCVYSSWEASPLGGYSQQCQPFVWWGYGLLALFALLLFLLSKRLARAWRNRRPG